MTTVGIVVGLLAAACVVLLDDPNEGDVVTDQTLKEQTP
jgi:hypothetical protein